MTLPNPHGDIVLMRIFLCPQHYRYVVAHVMFFHLRHEIIETLTMTHYESGNDAQIAPTALSAGRHDMLSGSLCWRNMQRTTCSRAAQTASSSRRQLQNISGPAHHVLLCRAASLETIGTLGISGRAWARKQATATAARDDE